MKRFGLSLFTLAAAAVIATGCSSNDDVAGTGEGASNDSSDGGEVTLTLWHPEGDMSEAYSEVIEQFNADHEGEIEAEITFIPRGSKYAYEDKISAGATSNTLPDLVALDGPNVANYAEAGIIQPIDGLVENQEDFVDSIITQGTFDDHLYTVGPTESTVALFYNVEMLEAAGITPPTSLEEAWTWDEFYEAAKTLTDEENGIYGVNWTLDYGEWIIYFTGPTVWSNGGSFIAEDGSTTEGYVNGPATVEALEYLQKFTNEGLVNLQPTPTEFEDGNAAMMLMGSWQWNKLQDYPETEWGITYYPRSNNGEQVSPSGDWNWGISTNTEHKEEAAILLNYIMNDENIIKLAEAGNKPAARISSFEQMTEWNEAPLSILKDQVLNTAHPRPSTTSYPVLSTRYGQAVQNIFLGGNVQEELDKVVAEVDTDISRK
ncbi:sugar ABC transporter substrate-binding protein [Halalkalibacter krulwichiae]|uniref:Putative ABC transporter substrate-binding protein YesO n=1 Tax=Halalkalibacter krulwichiae TaxID=199441 RepID=A0A1X9M8U6_9BACI|nr:sugar ABC transporter substrate-binding protein [Halalkalibacter krulwichiae]ARK29828.1 Putative ABC transporter substrate-binding protein YesO [Halalkalibacter krulwichiae]